MRTFRVGLVQQSVTASLSETKEKLAANIKVCATNGAQLVVLQELHNTPYFCQVEDVNNFDLAETIPGLFWKVGKKTGHCACDFFV